MASYQQIYLGPYILVKHKDTVKKSTKVVCINEPCRNYDMEIKTNFCPGCGRNPQSKNFETPDKETSYDCFDKHNIVDRLIEVHAGGTEIYEDRGILIPNQHMPEKLNRIRINDDFVGEVQLNKVSESLIKSQMDWLLNEYAKEIAVLKNNGFDLELRWGLVIHYN